MSRKSTQNSKMTPAAEDTRDIVMSQLELAALGGGKIAYIKMLSSDEAKQLYPTIDGEVPSGINLYALQAADGTPIALTDSLQAAMGHALGDDLQVASVH